MASWPRVIIGSPLVWKALKEAVNRHGLTPEALADASDLDVKTVIDILAWGAKNPGDISSALDSRLLGAVNILIVENVSKTLSVQMLQTRKGKKAIRAQAVDLMRQCAEAEISPPEALCSLVAECMDVQKVTGPLDLLTPRQRAIAKADATAWGSTVESSGKLAKELNVSGRAVRDFREHPAYAASVAAYRDPLIEAFVKKAESPNPGKKAAKGWDDIINIEAKIRQWAKSLEYPTDLSPGIERVFNDATELADYLIKERHKPADIL